MTEVIRQHTLIVSQDETRVTGIMLEKDWFSADYCGLFDYHLRIISRHGLFHVVGCGHEVSGQQAQMFVDAVLAGKIVTINLREFSMLPSPKQSKK